MKTFETLKNHSAANAIDSGRFQGGSEDGQQVNSIPSLIIGETISSATKLFIAKRRSEIGGLDALLKSLMRPSLGAK